VDAENALILAIFDLDDTLLSGDSDHAWFEFLCDENLIDGARYRKENERFYGQYREGALDVDGYLKLVCSLLAGLDQSQVCSYRARFVKERIKPLMQHKAAELVAHHRDQSHLLLVITSTLDFIVQPIVDLFGIPYLIAPQAERAEGAFNGRFVGVPSYREGKVTRLRSWLAEREIKVEESYFYSDSHNDIALLEEVTHPVVVDPDATLRRHAEEKGWRIISLRDTDEKLPEV